MKRYDRIKLILDNSINNENIGAHGPFWRALSLNQFKLKKIYGKLLVVPGDISKSNLILALRGAFPFGSDAGVEGAEYPRMPQGRPAITESEIAFIEQWIIDGCLDDEIE